MGGTFIYIIGPLYISFVIVHTKQTGWDENDVAAHRYPRLAVLPVARPGGSAQLRATGPAGCVGSAGSLATGGEAIFMPPCLFCTDNPQ
jgi:hypothetical protein